MFYFLPWQTGSSFYFIKMDNWMFLCIEIHLFCVFAAVQGLAFNRFFGFDCGGLVLPVRMCVL